MAANTLIGTWKLVSFEVRSEDGSVTFPWGSDVTGQVIYGPDGYMSGCLMPANRPSFASADVMGGSAAEFEAAMKSYIGYAGPYSLERDRVIHHANVSLFPNWTGTDIERFYEVDGNRLTLSTPPSVFGGYKVTAALVWEKLPARDAIKTAAAS
jgi:Lipocalin-like domain